MLNMNLRDVTDDCISTLTFDRLHAGELDESTRQKLARHLCDCKTCRLRERELLAEAQAFLTKYPRLTLPQVSQVVSPSKKRLGWLGLFVTASGLALAASFLLLLRSPELPLAVPHVSETRLKGGNHLEFHVKHGTEIALGLAGQDLFPGDVLRFVVSTAEPKHLAILSRDSAGTVSEYYPGTGQSRQVPGDHNHALETSVELDSTLGSEQIFGIFCSHPFSVEPLRTELAATSTLSTPAECSVERILFVKKALP